MYIHREAKLTAKCVGALIMVFNAGFVCALNLSTLLSNASSYHANWGKVGFAVFLGIMFAIFAYKNAKLIQRQQDEPWVVRQWKK